MGGRVARFGRSAGQPGAGLSGPTRRLEVLVDLGGQVESLRVQFCNRHPEQKAWLIEKRPWLDPKLELIGKPSPSPRSRAARPRRKQKAAQISVYSFPNAA